VPVLLDEVMAAFAPPSFRPRTYVDGTLGAGGHACAMLRAHAPSVAGGTGQLRLLVGVDVDPTAHALAGPRLERELERLEAVGRETGGAAAASVTIRLLRGNHADVARLLSGVAWPEALLGAHPTPTTTPPTLYGGVDAMLLDLGVSSMQIDDPERGFSFVRDGPLDMRMSGREQGKEEQEGSGGERGRAATAAISSPLAAPTTTAATFTAADIVNTWSEPALAELIRDYGEEKMWRRVAGRIVRAREERGPLLTTSQLVAAIGRTTLPRSSGGKGRSSSDIHPATRTFQALRIAVNDELGGLERALPAAIAALAPGGRLAVISFHSLEDRVVKHAMLRAAGKPTPADEMAMAMARTGKGASAGTSPLLLGPPVGRVLTRRPVLPSDEEVARNPRARSAKLRVFEKFGAADGGGEVDGQEAGGGEMGGSGSGSSGSSGGSRPPKRETHRSKKWRAQPPVPGDAEP
jgi:16S rRNA (cytosine1402-N4)-methyltransferase